MNVVLRRLCIDTLPELRIFCYCAARTVIEECSLSISEPGAHSHPSPPWEMRLTRRLQNLKRDLSHLHEFNVGRLSAQKATRLIQKYDLNQLHTAVVLERIKQTVKALTSNLNRY